MDTIINLSYINSAYINSPNFNHAQNPYASKALYLPGVLRPVGRILRCFGHDAIKCEYSMREYQLDNYRMIRIEICEPEILKTHKFNPLHYLYGYRRKRERNRLTKLIRQELAPLLDGRYDNFIIYQNNVPRECWVRDLLPFQEFDRYMEPKWVKALLKYAVNAHFVVLGNVPCLEAILCELAPRMKTLLWIAPDMTYQEQLEDFAEEFFQEYGLAINLNFIPDNGTYAQMRIQEQRYTEPVNILDFTGEKYIPFFSPPEGSVWIDMASVEEKERRIEARRIKAVYYSLKKQWRSLESSLKSN